MDRLVPHLPPRAHRTPVKKYYSVRLSDVVYEALQARAQQLGAHAPDTISALLSFERETK